jgi:hypothetical protein
MASDVYLTFEMAITIAKLSEALSQCGACISNTPEHQLFDAARLLPALTADSESEAAQHRILHQVDDTLLRIVREPWSIHQHALSFASDTQNCSSSTVQLILLRYAICNG